MTAYDFFLADYQHVSLMEYPGKISSIAFTHGCNIRCRYCHNPYLAVGRKGSNRLADFLDYLNGKDIEAVAVTGGEPLFSKNLHLFLDDLKSRGLAVKLDTNGFLPVKLAKILDAGLADYVAVDLKSFSPDDLKSIVRTPHKHNSFYKTIEALKIFGVPFEVRHTMWKMPEEADIAAVAGYVGDAPFYVQTLRDSRMLDKSFKPEIFDKSGAIKLIEKYFNNVRVR
ncbi:anaerobic ribonucleoside-triphosphate reductase activating protein [Seleniivibrio sp.]|uniref:anaerobic ribonucleoside-triphosphate reductase activating protein n=1 Tax=Seleniivibrio sp. TaxID=2898801 RepID=UPI0025EB71FA|nr:anaerobic ribonucleoside-triphosphate reductase activating protein [Seleniivibrio sp.]MCD8553848.1 anaerobic ribonucleoside-triphosphate reductase activating protein [Seleniivibrio sp.]